MQIRYEFNNKNFNLIPGAPIAYWVSQKFVKPFEVGSLLVDLIPVKKGMDTGDNDKYLRLWYETDYTKIDLFNHSKVYIPYDYYNGYDEINYQKVDTVVVSAVK